jgi:hypothetical protein
MDIRGTITQASGSGQVD